MHGRAPPRSCNPRNVASAPLSFGSAQAQCLWLNLRKITEIAAILAAPAAGYTSAFSRLKCAGGRREAVRRMWLAHEETRRLTRSAAWFIRATFAQQSRCGPMRARPGLAESSRFAGSGRLRTRPDPVCRSASRRALTCVPVSEICGACTGRRPSESSRGA